MEEGKRKYLESIYFDPENQASFGGIDTLYTYVKDDKKYKFTKDEIISFLQSQPVYTTRVNKKKLKRVPRFTVSGPRELFQADVAYMKKSGHKKFILGVVDVFSKKLMLKALTNIKAKTVAPALSEMIKELGGTRYLQTDFGSEFQNEVVRDELDKNKIHHYFARGRSKTSIMERSWRSIKNRLARAAEAAGTKMWHTLLPQVESALNNRKHRSLYQSSPNQIAADSALAADVWFKAREQSLKDQAKEIPYKYEINDPVRARLKKVSAFQKESTEQFDSRVYFIAARRKSDGVPLYTLKTDKNDIVPGSYAHDQLQKVILNNTSQYKIDKIVSRKIIDGVPHVKVTWQGYPDSYSSYIPKDQVKGYYATNPNLQLSV